MSYQSIPRPGSSGSSSNSGFQFLNSPFGDTTYTKVFVGGLAWETQSQTMRRYFEQFGEILEAVVISDKNTGRSKGYGFVTFRDPSAAQKACSDPSPIIDGRRANCNLASLGRPQPSPTYGHLRSVTPYFGSNQAPSGPYLARPSFQQTAPYSYQQGFAYPTYGYTAYGSEYIYPQGVYSPYMSQQFLQIGAPGTVNPVVYPYGQLTQPPPGTRGYTTFQGYPMPGHHVMQLSGTNSTGVTMTPTGAIQGPYHPGMVGPFPAQPHFIIPAPSPRFAQGSGSDQRQIEG